ncbi:MAG: hypothetical protein PHS07_04180, partial [Patescibacteria group bacterium]|nr:hypothetical protein [Patescibacteria group bacterium]
MPIFNTLFSLLFQVGADGENAGKRSQDQPYSGLQADKVPNVGFIEIEKVEAQEQAGKSFLHKVDKGGKKAEGYQKGYQAAKQTLDEIRALNEGVLGSDQTHDLDLLFLGKDGQPDRVEGHQNGYETQEGYKGKTEITDIVGQVGQFLDDRAALVIVHVIDNAFELVLFQKV